MIRPQSPQSVLVVSLANFAGVPYGTLQAKFATSLVLPIRSRRAKPEAEGLRIFPVVPVFSIGPVSTLRALKKSGR